MKKNTAMTFSYENQGDEQETRNLCTIYAPFGNAVFNGVISNFTEDMVKEVANRLVKAGNADLHTSGGPGRDGVMAVHQYITEDMGIACNFLTTRSKATVRKWIDLGYSTVIGINVNRSFGIDSLDNELEAKDYEVYRGGIGHFTNIMKWVKPNSNDTDKEFVMDSYFKVGKGTLYGADIDEILQDLAMPTKYCFQKGE